MPERRIARWLDQVRVSLDALGPEDTQPLYVVPSDEQAVPDQLIDLLRVVGAVLLSSDEATETVQRSLRQIGSAHGVDVNALVLPTGLLVKVGRRDIDMVTVPKRLLRLDQIAQLNPLIRQLELTPMSPADGLRRIERILATPPRFGPAAVLAGQVLLSLGFGLLLNPQAGALPFYVALGALVGVLRWCADRWPTLSLALPVVSAIVVTALSVAVVAPMIHADALQLLTPPLVAFLPGSTLTIATMELATAEVVSGASRLIWGISQLLLLTFGVVVGLALTNYQGYGDATQLGRWAPWVGVAVVAFGYVLFDSAPPGSLLFLLLALFGAYAAQTLGAVLIGPQLSGFVGGLVIVPMTALLGRIRGGPPDKILLLPAFWILVPGALGFRGISRLASGWGDVSAVVTTGVSLFAVALGVLVGTSLSRDVQAVRASLNTQPPQ